MVPGAKLRQKAVGFGAAVGLKAVCPGLKALHAAAEHHIRRRGVLLRVDALQKLIDESRR